MLLHFVKKLHAAFLSDLLVRLIFVLIVLTANISPLAAEDFRQVEAAIEEWWQTNPGASAVVVRIENRVIYEHYKLNQTDEDLMPIYSVTQSPASILADIALFQGHIPTLDAPMANYLKEEMSGLDAVTRSITIRHVLTMTTGLKSSWSMQGRPITS